MKILAGLCLTLAPWLAAQPPEQKPELTSLLGRPLFALPDTAGEVAKAYQALAADPDNLEKLLETARVRAALQQFHSAIDIYTHALDKAPQDPRLYRLRGHRFISLRRFDDAIRDLEKGVQLAPASFDISYHLGLAYYLQGEFGKAADEYARCMRMSDGKETIQDAGGALPKGYRSCADLNDDARVAIANWRYQALRRAGRPQEARRLLDTIHERMQVSENTAYYRALLFFKKVRSEEQTLDKEQLKGNQWVTAGYPVANARQMQGDSRGACVLWREIVDGSYWAAFGFIAAEVELARGRACR